MAVTLLEVIRMHAPQPVIAGGVRYYAEGRVRDLRVEGDGASAYVEGSRAYATRVTLVESGGIRSSCTCGAIDSWEICKHVVAVLVAMDRRRARAESVASWRDLAIPTPVMAARVERDVRYRVRLTRGSRAHVIVEALTPRAKGGEKQVALREIVGLRPSDRPLVEMISGSGWWEGHGVSVEPARALFVMPLLAQTGRATVTVDDDEETPLEWDAAPS